MRSQGSPSGHRLSPGPLALSQNVQNMRMLYSHAQSEAPSGNTRFDSIPSGGVRS